MLKFILFVLAGAVIYVLFSYVLRLFNLSDDLKLGLPAYVSVVYKDILDILFILGLIKRRFSNSGSRFYLHVFLFFHSSIVKSVKCSVRTSPNGDGFPCSV